MPGNCLAFSLYRGQWITLLEEWEEVSYTAMTVSEVGRRSGGRLHADLPVDNLYVSW